MKRLICVSLALVLGAAALRAQAPAAFELALVDVDGTKQVIGTLPPSTYAPRIAPDGKRIAFETRDPKSPEGAHIWVTELSNLVAKRAVPGTGALLDWAPTWSLDGERLVFIKSNQGSDAIYWRRADGAGDAEHLVDARAAEGWMPGGKQLRFLTLKESGGVRDYGIALLDIASHAVTPVVDLPGSAQHSSAVSPDGRWMAYASNETGRYEVWLEPLPQTGARHQLTREGGSHPLWLPDGRALYFDRDHRMFRLAFNPSSPSASNEPVALPITGFAQAEYRRQFDVLSNGRQFLMLFPRPVQTASAQGRPTITTLAGDVQADWAVQKEISS